MVCITTSSVLRNLLGLACAFQLSNAGEITRNTTLAEVRKMAGEFDAKFMEFTEAFDVSGFERTTIFTMLDHFRDHAEQEVQTQGVANIKFLLRCQVTTAEELKLLKKYPVEFQLVRFDNFVRCLETIAENQKVTIDDALKMELEQTKKSIEGVSNRLNGMLQRAYDIKSGQAEDGYAVVKEVVQSEDQFEEVVPGRDALLAWEAKVKEMFWILLVGEQLEDEERVHLTDEERAQLAEYADEYSGYYCSRNLYQLQLDYAIAMIRWKENFEAEVIKEAEARDLKDSCLSIEDVYA